MSIIILSSLSILALLGLVIYLFIRLRHITFYNVAIFAFLAGFWIIMSLLKKSLSDSGFSPWQWAIALSSYQFAQVVTRLPFGKLSQRLRSRKLPILISTVFITLSLVFVVASNFALWSIVLAMVFTGIFGATFGMQNQYWSENYHIRTVFITVAIVSIIPSLGSLFASLDKSIIFHFSSSPENERVILRWALVGATIAMALISIGYFFFPERKETIRLDNIDSLNHKSISSMGIGIVIKFSLMVVLISFGFNLVTSGGSYQDSIESVVEVKTVVLTIVSIATALVTSIYLARFFRVYVIVMLSNLLLILDFLFGVLIYFMHWNSNYIVNLIFLILLTIAFNIFQNTLLGTSLHFDHKNRLLVLGIWLTIRSFASGSGQLLGAGIMKTNADNAKWLILAALLLSIISLIYVIYISNYRNRILKNLYKVVDNYEYLTIRNDKYSIWKERYRKHI